MGLSRRKFTREFKIAALRQLETGVALAPVARSCEINPNRLHRWRQQFQHSAEHAFPGLGKQRAEDNRLAALERKIGQQSWEIGFLRGRWQCIQKQRMLPAQPGKPPSMARSGKK